MRVALVGAHGVGKTTLANALKEKLKGYKIIPDTAAMAYRKGWKVNEETTITNQLWILTRQIEYERDFKDSFIADKSLYDNLIYSEVLFKDKYFKKLLKNIIFEEALYNKIIYIPIEFGIEADGRSTDIEFQKLIDNLYVDFLKENSIKYHTVTGSVSNRLKSALNYINE